ncbi:carotenoid oxygenase family protein [Aerosakkonema funiforme]|uniref:carotenoid oxygenase family protein n=1 Tax=Aerosakkonema funiforme TaxID=1246630 RepID=UPI0035BB3238
MSFTITGRVYEAESGLGIPDLIVEAFDKDFLKNDRLGKAIANSDGGFEITYNEADFKGRFEKFEGNPDIFIVVKTSEGSQILYTTEKEIREEATENEHFEIAIPKVVLLVREVDFSGVGKQLLKILFGLAWMDGNLEPGELAFLQGLAKEKGLADDPEIKILLSAQKPVQPEEFYSWLQAYLGNSPDDKNFHDLYESLTSLIYIEGDLNRSEKQQIQARDTLNSAPQETPQKALERRFISIFLDRKFLEKLADTQQISPSDRTTKVSGYYAGVPQGILSRFSAIANTPAIADDPTKLYLTDNFAPIKEEISVENLAIIGELPWHLSGMFLRNGPNPQFPPVGAYHWFDGDGMLHGVRIVNGKASYRNRYIRTDGFVLEETQKQAIWPGLLNLPRFDAPYGLMMKNPANMSCAWHAGKLLTLWEVGAPHLMSLPELETLGRHNFGGKLTSAMCARPKVDPATGEMMFYSSSPIAPPYLEYSIVSADGELVQTVPIDLPEPVMMPDFAITEHYTIFLDMPLKFKPMRSAAGEVPIEFDRDRKSRIGILPRHGNNESIRWFTIPNCAIFHVANAYEEDSEVILIANRMDYCNFFVPNYKQNGEVLNFDLETLKMCRWRINLTTGVVKEEIIDDVPADFPGINDRLTGRRTRYVYASRVALYAKPKPLFDALIKYDLETGSSQVHEFGKGRFGGDSTFAPLPGGKAEDDGWLLTFVWDDTTKQSELVVIDARNFTGEPTARVIMPQRIPYGFHSIWIPS